MCLGSGDAAQAAVQQQQQQQKQIQQGLTQLNAIFGGGTYGTGPATSFTPGTQYYNTAGNPVSFNFTDPGVQQFLKQAGFGDVAYKTGGQTAQGKQLKPQPEGLSSKGMQDYFKYLQNQGGLYTGTATSPGFTPAFYQQQEKNYADYQLPLLGQQYNQTLGQTLGSLNSSGLLGSSAAQQTYQSLQNQYAQNQQQIANQGQSLAQGLQQQVGQEQSTLTNQLLAGASPATTTQQALTAASNFSAPSLFAPVGNLFQGWANTYLGGQLANAYQNQYLNPLVYNYNMLKTSLPSSSTVSQG